MKYCQIQACLYFLHELVVVCNAVDKFCWQTLLKRDKFSPKMHNIMKIRAFMQEQVCYILLTFHDLDKLS